MLQNLRNKYDNSQAHLSSEVSCNREISFLYGLVVPCTKFEIVISLQNC